MFFVSPCVTHSIVRNWLSYSVTKAKTLGTKKRNSYRKYLNLVRTHVEIISDPNYWKIIFKATNLVHISYFSGNLEEKVLELRFIFVSQKFVIYKILNTLKLFWFTIDSFVLLNEGVPFFFHDIRHFFVCIGGFIKLYKRII